MSALQSVGNIIGEVLKNLGNDKFIVKASSGPRYVVGVRSRMDQSLLKIGTRVALDMTTLTVMRLLPREVDPTVFQMQVSFVESLSLRVQAPPPTPHSLTTPHSLRFLTTPCSPRTRGRCRFPTLAA